MNMFTNVLLYTLALSASSYAFADEADQLLDRQKTLNTMEFKRDQLKLQADMSEAFKRMSDARFIVDTEGVPLGVDNMQKLGIDVRTQGRGNEQMNPFEAGSSPMMPNGAPFMLDQPNMNGAGSRQAFTGPTLMPSGRGGSDTGSALPAEKQPASDDEVKKVLQLLEVSSEGIIVRTNNGNQALRIGDKVYDLKLARYTIDKAYLKGPKGTQVISIDWTKSKRYADD